MCTSTPSVIQPRNVHSFACPLTPFRSCFERGTGVWDMRSVALIFSASTLAISGIASGQDVTAQPSQIVARNRLVVAKFYPPESIRRGEEGQVQFRIVSDKRGRLDACQVVKSSGYAALDTATCDMMLAGATATPLRNGKGWHVVGARDGIVDWTLPEDAPRPATPPPFTALRNAVGVPLICKRQTKSGSAFITEKVCLTREDWHRAEEYAQAETFRMQNPQGAPTP
jgi:TonB family protein